MTTPAYIRYNQIVEVQFRAGLIGFFAGENQTKALNRALDRLNAEGFCVAAMVVDRWSFWRRLLWVLILIVTLGFVGRVPNVLIATEPIPRNAPAPPLIAPPAVLTATEPPVEAAAPVLPTKRPAAKKVPAKKATKSVAAKKSAGRSTSR